MGKGHLGRNGKVKHGADGANIEKIPGPSKMKLIRSCKGALNYLRQGRILIEGYPYGSDFICINTTARKKLFALIAKIHHSEYGEFFDFQEDEVIQTYSATRKGNHGSLRDAVAIQTPEEYPLFPEPVDELNAEPIAIIYAYWGSNQKAKRRLIKIGYTSQHLGDYLRNLERAYDPKLLATKPGGRSEERAEHARYGRHLAEGREWFHPTQAMLDDFAREWTLDESFKAIAEEIKQQMGG